MSRRTRSWTIVLAIIVIANSILLNIAAAAETVVSSVTKESRCVAIELYRGKQAKDDEASREMRRLAATRPGWAVKEFNVEADRDGAARFAKICKFFNLKETTPLVYLCGRAIIDVRDAQSLRKEVLAATTMTVFVRDGCPHCAQAKEYVKSFHTRYPSVEIQFHDVVTEPQAARDLQELARKHRTAAVSVPVFHVCDQLIVGFDQATATGKRIEAVLDYWSRPCTPSRASRTDESRSETTPRPRIKLATWRPKANSIAVDSLKSEIGDSKPDDTTDADLPLPEPSPNVPAEDSIQLPYVGRVSVSSLGMPLFTIIVGLVDGFNPCAMWVLVFLLSVLVNLRNRWKILAVAGTFVIISGAAYLAFMAAWMNVFLFVGLLRWVQIVLALIAIGIGATHVKDFFAFKQGITFSIPESAKPGIYQRVHRIVMAENLFGAIVGASALAILVNMVEILCTAGLPALYTNILAAQQLPAWKNYAYLLLYIVGYMFDDTVMLVAVIVTLSHRKMQETEGRWLKLVSGLVIIMLGIIMLMRPRWLGLTPYLKAN